MSLNLPDSSHASRLIKQRASHELWRRGEFASLVLKGPQLEMLDAYDRCDNIMYFFLCSRRIGKSMTLLSLAVRECLKRPNARVLYLSTTTENTTEITDQTADVVFETCPPDLRPVFRIKQSKFVFPNGSEIRIKGLDKVKGTAIRGVKANLIIFDEACFMLNLNQIVDSVALPMAIATGGKIVFGSTPPDSPGHDSVRLIARCEAAGACIRRNIYTMRGILYSDDQIDLFEKEAGGKDTTIFRREYMAEVVVESDLAIVPAATEDKLAVITQDIPLPEGYKPDLYVGLDIGWRDMTVALFAFWDYENAKLIVQDEAIFREKSATTENIAKGIKEVERRLWGPRQVYKRYADNNQPILLADLKRLHDLPFNVTAKDNKEAQVNHLNIMVANEQILINPRCKTLITQLKYGAWKENRTEFARSKDLGHCDAIDALIYLLRNVKRNRNVIEQPSYAPSSFVYHGDQPQHTSNWDALKAVLK